jgi:hypothetical protein
MAPRTMSPHENRSASERDVKAQVSGKSAVALATEVAVQIEARVHNRLAGRVHYFRVQVRDTGLILHGRAHTYYAKQLAQHVVMEAGFPILANEIEVS